MRERVGNGRQYIIEWADQTVQLQVQTLNIYSPRKKTKQHKKNRPEKPSVSVAIANVEREFVRGEGWLLPVHHPLEILFVTRSLFSRETIQTLEEKILNKRR